MNTLERAESPKGGLASSFPPSKSKKKIKLGLFESLKRGKKKEISSEPVSAPPTQIERAERVQDSGFLSLQDLKKHWKIGLFCTVALAETMIWKQHPRGVLVIGCYWIAAEILFSSSQSFLVERTAQASLQAFHWLKKSGHNQDLALGALAVLFIASGDSLNVKLGSLIILFTLGREWALYSMKKSNIQ